MIIKRIKPVKGANVARPTRPHLFIPTSGERVEWSSYWQKMLQAEVIEIVPDKQPEPKKAAKDKGDLK